MSNVLSRDRGLSGLTFYTHLMKTRQIMTDFLGNASNFKARDYYTYCSPILKSMIDVTQSIIIANSIYPLNNHEVMIRRDYQNIAIGQIESAITELTIMVQNFKLSISKGSKMREIIDALREEVKYLKWWRKQNNSLMKKFRELNEQGKASTNPYGIEAAIAKLAADPVPFVPPTKKAQVDIPEFVPQHYYGEPGREKRADTVCPIYSLEDYPPIFQHDYNTLFQNINSEGKLIVEGQKDDPLDKGKSTRYIEKRNEENENKSQSRSRTNPKRRPKVDNFFDKAPIGA